jgi:hypothetical protein
MDNFGQKLVEIKQKQKRLHENSQAKIESSSAKKSQYILALGGVVAGLTIAVILLLAKMIVVKDNTNLIAPKSVETIHTIEINKTNDNIAQLNERVELITESISDLESILMRIIALTDSNIDVEKKHTSSSKQHIPESADAELAFDTKKPNDSKALHMTPEAVKGFVPTHTIKDRLNLRPSSSFDSTPIAVLKAGSEVEYIKEADGWYYVDTPLHGKGWCSSEYLSPLSPIQ